MRTLLLLAPLLILASCSQVPNPFRTKAAPAPVPAAAPAAAIGQSAARPAESLDLTSEAERQRALATTPDPGAKALGEAVVTLGNAAEPGFWLRSSLVKSVGKGRVEVNGKSVAVDLLPGAGSAQLSLAGYRALDLPLTALPQVTVYAN
ncbi:hypothetical protein [Falsirhodobacter sp. 20TX0035]|uniref:hypothetical protein n=1 Tax=Falsirhodobacter sp. 20TX0035 TaxID=3022019 RepID=UPI00232DBF05|nr:hypothetical protein [Falsirhodobacter sp. 20TX0035]MDB6454333.1 hypothetical protein [Falsirhodobacter sp. 20TX0035]